MKIQWANEDARPRRLYFADLAIGETFRNASGRGYGAVYAKVADMDDQASMMELATGRLWPPTASVVERVAVEVNIPVAKPAIYG